MAHDILQRFLSAKLFDVVGDDDRLNKLRAAAEDLTTAIKGAPHRAPIFAMVAIDAKILPSEPVLAEVASLLEKRWNSYAGAFSSETLPVVIRAIILDALSRLSNVDAVAIGTTLTARTFLPLIGSPSDRELWIDVIDDADRRLEARARKEWALPSSAVAHDFSLNLPAISDLQSTTIKREFVSERLAAAVGPNDPHGAVIANGNPHWPNQGQPWSNEFVPRAAKAVADVVDTMAKAMTDKINAQASGKAIAEAINAYVAQVAASFTQTSIGLERRTSLLWWKESLYSPILKSGYRQLDLPLAAAWMAVDAVDLTGPYAPRMAEAFLSETVHSLDRVGTTKPMKAAELFAAVAGDQSSAAQQVRQLLAQVTLAPGRTPLAALIGNAVAFDSSALVTRLGLGADQEVDLGAFATWLYRDLQAAKATEGGGKKRRAK